MKVFLSGFESSEERIMNPYIRDGKTVDYILCSYYYLRRKGDVFWEKLKKVAKEILIDSGAHSFQKGAKVEWLSYTMEFADWIEKHDCPQVIGYFEMDIDNIVPYEKVLELRKILESKSNKIIPVWHKNRGIEEYKKMCRDYSYAAITGLKNTDIEDRQYPMFLKYAAENKCRIHCLGMTRMRIIEKLPFYSVDSSTWLQSVAFGIRLIFKNGRMHHERRTDRRNEYTCDQLALMDFEAYVQEQKFLKEKWSNYDDFGNLIDNK